ncbi:MAG TPA: hypothetical protein VNO30_27870 [Kofleriaceae bacterium]|nr:hypothetical protein [Kofleriaceae bacterium]
MTILATFVVVLLALFVISVVHRPDDRGLGSGCSSRQRAAWRARLLRTEPVAPGQLAGCTAAPGRFTITGACALKIAAAEARSRRLIVEAVDAVELRRVTNADGRLLTMRAELEPGERTEIVIGKEGETLGLRCLTGATCRAGVE